MEQRLKDLPPGSHGEVIGYSLADRGYKDRLLAMGLTKGTRFTVLRIAPLGDPVEISVRDFTLSLRKGEAEMLIVRKVAV
ncbi:MAG: ferrous iron transport protein A [Spirochaetia bacterium]|jgi:ferrous iron transport protein A|uniref:Fe(2+) transport protein A n=1 Tax=bioreactor metagenome TaxID=1076179 RepID=A0A644TN98_9ZZZZ